MASFVSADEIVTLADRELIEIDENLMRSELSPTETAEHLARRKELWQGISGNTVPENNGRGRPEGFASSTANSTGLGKRAVNQSIARAEAVFEEARDLIRQATTSPHGRYARARLYVNVMHPQVVANRIPQSTD